MALLLEVPESLRPLFNEGQDRIPLPYDLGKLWVLERFRQGVLFTSEAAAMFDMRYNEFLALAKGRTFLPVCTEAELEAEFASADGVLGI